MEGENMSKVKNIEPIEIIKLKQIKISRPDWRLTSSKAFGEKIISEIGNDTQEVLLLIGTNAQNDVLFISRTFVGGTSQTQVDLKSIFQRLILNNCVRFIIAHNHPGGSLVPSSNDIAFTSRLYKAACLLGFNVMDSIIVNDECYFSFAEEGILESIINTVEEEKSKKNKQFSA